MKHINYMYMTLFLAFVFLLSGCSGSNLISRTSYTSPEKISKFNVTWKDNKNLKYTILKSGKGVTQELAEERARITREQALSGQTLVKDMLHYFRENAADTIMSTVNPATLPNNSTASIFLTPTEISHFLGGGRSITVKCSLVIDGRKDIAWTATIRANGARYISNKDLLSQMNDTLFNELRDSGWI